MASSIESSGILSIAGRKARRSARPGRYRSATALAGGLAATILLAMPAMAQDSRGGNGGQGNSAPSPVGGTSSSTGAGGAGAGTTESYEGAAGGGAGVTGGNGGNASDGGLGGAGGATAGAAGGNGVGGGIGSRASGGGGGAHGAYLSGAPGSAVSGGMGGTGGSSNDGDGGGGGAGGYGAVATGGSLISFDYAITGGNGGGGGNGYFYGGSGGDGGHGLVLLTDPDTTVSLNATIAGGNGGVGGTFVAAGCCAAGSNGAGGIGLIASDISIVLHASVRGGLSGGGTRALAMRLGGVSQINLASGWGLVGGIEVAGTSLEFVQGNDRTLSNDISGVGTLIKSSIGNLTLSGNNSYAGGTEIRGGTLTMGSANALSNGNITITNNGILDLGNQTVNLSRGITGTGTVRASGSGALAIDPGASVSFGGAITSDLALSVDSASTLTLYGNNNLTGGITLSGRLVIGDTGAAGGSGNTITTTGSVISYANGVDNTANIQIASNTTQLEVLGTDSATQSGVISEDQSGRGFEKIGTGTLILSATNSYSGTTVVTSGVLGLAANGAAGTGAIELADNASLFNAAPCGCALTIGNDIRIALGGTAAIGSFGNDTVLSGAISGGHLLFSEDFGTGTFTLTNANSYGVTGIASLITLRVGDGGTTGTLGTDFVTVDGRLVFDRSDSITVSNDIDGSGSLTQAGGGTLILTGANSYSGGTTISQGLLQVGSGGTAGTLGTGTISNDGALIFNRSDDLAVSDYITGSGSITKLGANTLTLNATNSDYTGSTNLLGGTLAVTEFGLGATALVSIDNGATLAALENAGTDKVTILSGGGTIDTGAYQFEVVNGADFQGTLTKTGAGTLLLSDLDETGTGAGGINVVAGTLALGSDFAAGTGTIALASGTTLYNAGNCLCGGIALANGINVTGTATIDSGGNQTYLDGPLTGGNIRFADSIGSGGTITLTADNSYGDTVVGTLATLIVGEDGTTGSLGTGSVTVEDLAMLAFDRSDTVTLAIAVSGDGLIGQFGRGTLILTGDNSNAGGTVILNPDGILQVGDGGTSGALGAGTIFNMGQLVFDRADDITVSQEIAGDGRITKLGANTLTLNGDNLNGSFGPFAGTVSVQGGTLAITQFALGASELLEIDNGAQVKLLEDSYAGSMAILSGGGTIDTGAYTLEAFGGVDFQGELTKTGSGTLLLVDFPEEGTGSGGINVTAGTLGLGSDFAAGTGTIKLADGTTLLSCGCGLLTVGNALQIAAGGTVTIDADGGNVALTGTIDGGNVSFTAGSSPGAASSFTLSGTNSYGGTRIGANVALVLAGGTLGTGDLVFDAAPSDPGTPAEVRFENSSDYGFGGRIVGGGLVTINPDAAAKVTLTGSNSTAESFTGVVDLVRGTLVLNGALGDMVGNSALLNIAGGTLGGSGSFHGSVDIDNAALNPGNSPGTLAIAGNLTLGAGTILNFELGAPGTVGGASNDLLTVGGDLRLDGTLNVLAWGAGYGPGYYRLFNYGGNLDDQGLDIGTIAGGLAPQLLTNIGGQVNLRLGGAQAIQYWDGADLGSTTGVAGGAGSWTGTTTNWTGPSGFAINDAWQGQVGVFGGAAGGTVTVFGAQNFEELRFATDGYALRPSDPSAALGTTGGFSIIDVASGVTADIGVVIQGAAGIDKTGAGTLTLSTINVYNGATDIAAGTLRLGSDGAIPLKSALNVQSGATLDLAGFDTMSGSIAGAGAILLGGGEFETGYDNSSTIFSGTITGPDGGASTFGKMGTGTLTLSGTVTLGTSSGLNSLARVNGGTLQIGGTGSLSADQLQNFATIDNAGTIATSQRFQNIGTLTNASTGTITGPIENGGALDNYGTMGALQLTGGSAVNHGTGVIGGTIDNFASFASTGIINGDLNNGGTAQLAGQLNGALINLSAGPGTTLTGTITGITYYQGASGSTLDLAGFDTQIGGLAGTGAIQLGSGRLTVAGGNSDWSFLGTINGSGGLSKTGSGKLTLSGASNYDGTTSISGGGTLSLADSGAIGAGAVSNNATLDFTGSANRVFANSITGSGNLSKSGLGVVTLTGANAYGGGTQVFGGTIGFNNGQSLGSGAVSLFNSTGLRNVQAGAVTLTNAIGIVSGTATLEGLAGSSTTLNGPITGGNVNFAAAGGGTASFTLNGTNTYAATQIGAGAIVNLAGGTLGTGNLVLAGTGATLNFANSTNYNYAGVITGNGHIGVNTAGGASVTLSGSNVAGSDFTGTVTVDAGKLVLNGDFGDVTANTASMTLNGGSLGGSGTFHGDLSLGGGTLNPGNSPGTLNIAGNLSLGAATILNFELSEAGTVGGANNDLVNVGGSLTLDGTLNVTALTGFGEGYYRLFNYGGTLTDNGLLFGGLPGGYTSTLLTNIGGQVNILFASSPQAIQYWDGSDLTGSSTASGGNGGAGIWSGTSTNWTAPTGYGVNDSWHGQVAVFGGAAGGTVTVQGSQVFQELRFTTGGYTIAGATAAAGLATTGGFSVIDVASGIGATINAAISGTGGLTKTGAGTLTLGGANSHTGLTTVSTGTLVLAASGSLAGAVQNNATFNNLGSVAGPVTNTGVLANTGTIAGAVQNNATFSNSGTVGGLVANAGTLTSTGTLAGGLLNNGTATLAGTIGTGIVNNSSITLSGAATIAALQQAASGSFNLAGFGSSVGTLTGSGAITLGSGTLSIGAGNGNSSFAGTIAGTGGLAKTGTGTLVLTGAATQTGGTTISGGTLQIGNGGTTGALAGAITNNGVLAINRSDAVTLANVMSGTGGFVQAGSGTTTLTGANSYSGGTIVSAGRLRGDVASLQGAIRIDSALEFAQTGGGTYAGSLSGAGLFEKTGTGTLTLTGNSATYTGATNVLAGTLAVNGLLTRSLVTVSNGAMLNGTGTVGGITVQSGGTLAPGNSVGTLNVAGNVLFQAGSLFAAEVQASGADRVQATGTAQLGGTLQVLNLGGSYAINSTYVLLHADAGVSGTFAVTNLAGFGLAYRPKIVYTANEVQLFLAANQLSAVLGTSVALTYNQASAIGRLDAAVVTGGYDPTALSALYSLSPAAIPAALDQLSGEIYADATRAALEDERVVREAVLGRLGEAADAGFTGTGSWGQVIGSWGSVDSDGNGAGYDVDRTGMMMGIDNGAETDTGSWRAGVMGHYTRITLPADARGSRATIDRTGGGVYAGVAVNNWRIRAGASLSLLDMKARRAIAVPGLTTSERGKARGVMLQSFAEISYRIDAGRNTFVEPYLAGSATRVTFGKFAESSGPVALMVQDQKSVLGIGELGLRGETALVGGDKGSVRLDGNIGLRTAFGDRAPDPAIALAAAPSLAFNIRSAEIDRFSAVANLNLIVDVSDKLSLRLGYSGVQGAGVREHGGRATLSLSF